VTIPEAFDIVKSLFASDIGTIPRGSIETSLRVKVSRSPTKISIRTHGGQDLYLKKQGDLWVLNEAVKYPTLKDVLIEVLALICEEEISFRLGGK
jgi:hypothetical protein